VQGRQLIWCGRHPWDTSLQKESDVCTSKTHVWELDFLRRVKQKYCTCRPIGQFIVELQCRDVPVYRNCDHGRPWMVGLHVYALEWTPYYVTAVFRQGFMHTHKHTHTQRDRETDGQKHQLYRSVEPTKRRVAKPAKYVSRRYCFENQQREGRSSAHVERQMPSRTRLEFRDCCVV